MVRAIVFDFDGVLVESVEVKTNAFARLFAEEDSNTVERIVAYHLSNGGISRFEKFRAIYRDILQRPLSDKQFRALCDAYAKLVVDEVVAAPWVEGAEEFLRVNGKRFALFVVSGTPEDELKEIIRRRGSEKFFQEVLGSPQTKDVLLRGIMQRYALDPMELLFVGDAESDWLAARQLEIRFIWRQVTRDLARPSGFAGPAVASLVNLESHFALPDRTGT